MEHRMLIPPVFGQFLVAENKLKKLELPFKIPMFQLSYGDSLFLKIIKENLLYVS